MADFVDREFDDKESNWNCCGETSTVSRMRSSAILVTYIVPPMYHPLVVCRSQVPLAPGFLYIIALFPGGASGVHW